MGRRKHMVYARSAAPAPRLRIRLRDSLSTVVSDGRQFAQADAYRSSVSAACDNFLPSTFPCSFRSRKFVHYRALLQTVISLLAALSLLTTSIGFFAFHIRKGKLEAQDYAMRVAVIAVSIAQSTLICLYWKYRQRYERGKRAALGKDSFHILKLSQSPKQLGICLCECAFHLLTSLPGIVFVSDLRMNLYVSERLFLGIIARNYHIVRAVYWLSQFSSYRTELFANATHVAAFPCFLLRSLLAEYSFRLLTLSYLAIVVLPGLFQSALEPSSQPLPRTWDSLWMVAITQTTVGYGEATPSSFSGQVSILLTCFSGIFTLGLLNSLCANNISLSGKESDLAGFLMHREVMQRYTDEIVVLLQRWWRLMRKRQARFKNSQIVLKFYSGLSAYREKAIIGQRVQAHGFQHQSRAFASSAGRRIRTLTEYVKPVLHAYTLVSPRQAQDLARRQFCMRNGCWKAARLARRCVYGDFAHRTTIAESGSMTPRRPRLHFHRDSSLHTERSGPQQARSKQSAFLYVKGRLVREGSTPGTASPSSSSFSSYY